MIQPYTAPAFGPRRERTPALVARCAIRYAKGMSLADIAILENCAAPTIRSILAEAGITIRKRGIATDSWRYCTDRRRPETIARDSA